ncbi:MAG: HEAT repeat domain-containing protein [Phycisphaerae bacterium]|jgi:HEAT repeat protein|nr:HEAT repeat domain-containing protein [Phycisphaerae bacterium]
MEQNNLSPTREFTDPQVSQLAACEAALALSKTHREKALQLLVSLSRQGDATIRVRAAECMMEIGSDRAVMELLDLCDDHNPRVRLTALGALGVLRIHKAKGKITHIMRNDPEISVRIIAARTLGKLGSRAGILLIYQLLFSDNRYYHRLAVLSLHDIINQRFSPTPEGIHSARRYLEINKYKFLPGEERE